jgi:uncharacterized protein
MSLLPPLPDFANASLAELMRLIDSDALPPVEAWHPAHVGVIDIRISADGRWWHEGGEITRPALVRLFSRVLRREPDGSYVLVTPAEKLTIMVEDTPLLAVEAKTEGVGRDATIAFRLNTGDVVVAGAAHPLSVTAGGTDGAPHPLLHVRGAIGNGITARLVRSVWLDLAEAALADGEDPPALWSGGARFPLLPA